MRAVVILSFLILFSSVNASEKLDNTTCGIPTSEIPAYMINAYIYGEFRGNNEITADEAVIWEYSTDPYCSSEEYEENLDESLGLEVDKNDDGSSSLGPVFRKGFKDKCHYRADYFCRELSF